MIEYEIPEKLSGCVMPQIGPDPLLMFGIGAIIGAWVMFAALTIWCHYTTGDDGE